MNVKVILVLICGICWSITFIDAIRIGIKDNTYAIPFLAIALNFSWEVYNTIQGYLITGFYVTTIISSFWSLFDLGILYTYLKYGNRELNIKNSTFYILSIAVLALSLVFQHLIGSQLGSTLGAAYSGFWINLLMSILFIRMFYRRPDLNGQTLLIAITKCVGTFSITILAGAIGINRLGGQITSLLIIGLLTFIVDVFYIYILNKKRVELLRHNVKYLEVFTRNFK